MTLALSATSPLQVYRALTASTAPIPGATVENNKFCLSVHFRCVQEEVRICEHPWVSIMCAADHLHG